LKADGSSSVAAVSTNGISTELLTSYWTYLYYQS